MLLRDILNDYEFFRLAREPGVFYRSNLRILQEMAVKVNGLIRALENEGVTAN